jgi:hypothetical protein
MTYDGVQEVGGVLASAGTPRFVEVKHYAKGVLVEIEYASAILTPAEARSLARKLYRQARRWESAQAK